MTPKELPLNLYFGYLGGHKKEFTAITFQIPQKLILNYRIKLEPDTPYQDRYVSLCQVNSTG